RRRHHSARGLRQRLVHLARLLAGGHRADPRHLPVRDDEPDLRDGGRPPDPQGRRRALLRGLDRAARGRRRRARRLERREGEGRGARTPRGGEGGVPEAGGGASELKSRPGLFVAAAAAVWLSAGLLGAREAPKRQAPTDAFTALLDKRLATG